MVETFGLMIVAGMALGLLVLVALVFKVLLKLLLLPFLLAAWAVKGFVLLIVGLVMLAVLGPLVLGAGIVFLIPILLLAGIVWGAVAVFG
ncbi:MAG: hypothetical protein GXP48_01975 [Acidobacteria bacterium]|nr:hypothetical protein [Acidobacteriota bacterium]